MPPSRSAICSARAWRGLAGIFTTDDCRATHKKLGAEGVEFVQEPVERFYGIDCAIRDPFGNSIRITQPALVPTDAGSSI